MADSRGIIDDRNMFMTQATPVYLCLVSMVLTLQHKKLTVFVSGPARLILPCKARNIKNTLRLDEPYLGELINIVVSK